MVAEAKIEAALDKALVALKDPDFKAGDLTTDQAMQNLAELIHPTLPFPIRMALKPDALARFLIKNRDRVQRILS